jgi:hypothetical protein
MRWDDEDEAAAIYAEGEREAYNEAQGATVRCQATTASGSQCKCYATSTVNRVPYCDQHAAKAVREAKP